MRPHSFTLAAALAAASGAHAQSPLALDEIIVTGTRLATPATEVGSSVSVITAADIARRGYRRAEEALAALPGVSTSQSGGPGSQTNVFIRGISGDKVLVVIDGVTVNDPTSVGGGLDFGTLDAADIDRIEVLKGPQSTLYGSDAIGGVINIVTKRAGAGLHASGFAEYGSFDTKRGGVTVSGGSDLGELRLSATRTDSDGFSRASEKLGNTEDDGFENTTLTASGALNLPLEARLSGSLRHVDSTIQFDAGGFAGGDNFDEEDRTESSGSLKLQAPMFGGALKNEIEAGFAHIDREITSAFPFSAEGDRRFARYQGEVVVGGWNRAVFGAETEFNESGDGDNTINSVFGLWETKPVEGLTLTAGLRVDDHSEFASETTARVAAAYQATDALTLRGSWGQGFKAPSIFQTTFGVPAPNPNLRPETSDGFDAGVEYSFLEERGVIGVTYFNQDIEDEISFFSDPGFTVFGYENLASTSYEGVEATAGYDITPAVRLSASYTYTDARDDTTGDRLFKRPEHTAEGELSYGGAGPFSGSVIVRYNSSERDFGGATLDEWIRVDLTAAYAITKTVDLYGRVENLFDEDYEETAGFGTAGRSGFVGIRARF
jgi:vitamin B12 transporter